MKTEKEIRDRVNEINDLAIKINKEGMYLSNKLLNEWETLRWVLDLNEE